MGKIENDKLRRIRNEHFIRAFDHVARCLSMTQGELAEAIGTKTAYISNFRKGIRPVTEDAIGGLIRISATKSGLQVFSEYLYGNSDIMLLDNVSDEEIVAARKRHNNPDYDKIEKQKAASPSPAEPPANIPDMSSVFNAAIAAKDDAIESLKREAASKEDLIADLRARIIEKDDHIATLKARIAELQQLLAIQKNTDLGTYPFPVGVADDKKQRKNL